MKFVFAPISSTGYQFFLMTKTTARRLHSDSLYRNSIYLILSQLVLAVLGFLFWVLNARLFSPSQIGVATTMISIAIFITNISQMGFNTAIISYLSNEEKKKNLVNTAYIIVSSAASIFTLVFLLFLPIFSKELLFLKDSPLFMLFFVLFLVASSLNAITDSIFIAMKDTKFILFINILVAATKLVAPFFFIQTGNFGIFYAFALATLVGMVTSLATVSKIYSFHFSPKLNTEIVKKVWRLSSSSFLANMLMIISGAVTPILILNKLGASSSAYYYMPTMIINLLYTIPRSISSSLFAEGSSQKQGLYKLCLKSISSGYLVLFPAIMLVLLFGKFVLLAFGKNYSTEGYTYLALTSLSLLIVLPNYVLGTVLNIRKDASSILAIGFIQAVVSLILVYVLSNRGLLGVGFATILSQFFLLTLYSGTIYIKNVKKSK